MKIGRKRYTDGQRGNRIEFKLGAGSFLNTYPISNGKTTNQPSAHLSVRSPVSAMASKTLRAHQGPNVF